MSNIKRQHNIGKQRNDTQSPGTSGCKYKQTRSTTEEKERDRKTENEEGTQEIGEDEKRKICMEMEDQETQHTIHSCDITLISDGRIQRPRKKGNLRKKEIHETLFKVQEGENRKTSVLTLNAKLANKSNNIIECIVDTGSNINLINSKLVDEDKIEADKTPKVVSANNTPITILGTTEITLEVDNIIIRDRFYVTPDTNSDIILGNKFLNKNRVELNYNTKEIILNLGQYKHKIKMAKKWLLQIESINTNIIVSKHKITDIKTEEDIVIAPHQHRRIKLKFKTNDKTYFEPEKSLQEKKKCHAYLIDGENENCSYINIYNASSFPKHINANTMLGYLSEETKSSIASDKPIAKVDKQNPNKSILTDKDGIELDISPHLNEHQHNKVVRMLQKYLPIFTTKTQDLTPANLPPVGLELIPGAKPVNSPPYKQSAQERQELNKILDELTESGILEQVPDYCPFASPVFLTKNKDNSPRLVGDMRKVNNLLKPCVHPTPSINLVLNSLNQANSFSKLDLKNAYHLLTIREEDRNIVAIRTTDRFLRYKRLTMGLKVSSALFSKAILALLNKHLYNKVIAYIDDVIVYGKNFEEDLNNLDTILEILQKANLKLNTKKCKFLYNKVDILGYTVSKQGILPQESSVEAINNFKRPDCIRKVRQFLGSSSFFRKHIKNYAEITLPLTNLIKDYNKNNKFKWDEKCEDAFNKIKQLLTNPPLLAHWNDDWESVIYVDSSNYAMGASLLQINPETNNLHPIAYLSKKYTDTQARYANAEREMLGLVYAVNYWREFTLGRKTTVYTDCQALIHYQNFKNTSSRLNRLALSLVDYDITVKYKKGTSNLLADSLSRNPTDDILEEDPLDIVLNINEIETEDFEMSQARDPYLKLIKLAKISPEAVPKKIRNESRKYEVRDGLIYYKKFNGRETEYLLAIPKEKVIDILKTFHDNIFCGGHFSNYKTAKKIKVRYFWNTMVQDIENYTKSCQQCQLKRSPTYKQFDKLTPQIPPTVPFERLIIDFMGPITQSNGFKYILVITDPATRMVIARPTRLANAQTVAKVLLELFCQYGCPRIITHDQGTSFMSNVLKQLLQSLGIQQKASPPYMQRIQGLTERMNLIFKKTISHYIENEPHKWSDIVKYVAFAYNTTVNQSTGFTPFYLMYAREATMPSDYILYNKNQDPDMLKEIRNIQRVRREVPKIIQKAQLAQKKYFDATKRDLLLQTGDQVLVKFEPDHSKAYNKFQDLYKGPYFVTGQVNDSTYTVELYKRGKLVNEPVHISKLKPFYNI